jgi:translation initiation factor 2 subunit 2
VAREGTKKTLFANIVDICKRQVSVFYYIIIILYYYYIVKKRANVLFFRMHRQPDHLIQYLFAELGTQGSIDGAQRLLIKGRFQQKQIEIVLKRYIGKSFFFFSKKKQIDLLH